ncbi:glycosidase [Oceanispirochaeta crateris]|uniref:Glycosidase n=1 Tax=Oceanispirochaeta crateris TaxID=2518645 RepID=A0A5C1QMQ3_9SPIO|nr:glycoside hydrolase family 130 protein [Oceanispirochaeta crateris]QEN08499.1 glycosidase [Oceanispirochaeta crateris]
MGIAIKRLDTTLYPDPKRVIARFYLPGGEDRGRYIIQKIMSLSEEKVQELLQRILGNYANRHRNITNIFENHFNNVSRLLAAIEDDPETITQERKRLIGAYFTHEYSIESAAFFNPSIIEDPDQSHLEEGQKRLIVSFRATGEGHISSIVFRSVIIDQQNKLSFQRTNDLVEQPETIRLTFFNKQRYISKLDELNIHKDIVDLIMKGLGDEFTYKELNDSIHNCVKDMNLSLSKKNVIKSMIWLADAHYDTKFSMDTALTERVIFPASESEKNGIEDARFVKFTDDDGKSTYYATYTAYNGFATMSKLLETKDFYQFTTRPLHGKSANSKGMALFPRKIRGQYAMISRIDGFCNYVMYSDSLTTWQDEIKIEEPQSPWEFVQIGNCGSPIETEYGWLLLTHGVGAMREYCLGISLLDLDHPEKVICQLEDPILIPNQTEREGYVPNVVYSCGSIIHNNDIIIPYGLSDSASSFAALPLDLIFEKMHLGRHRS